jgi:3-oxoacyl-[acyl-carrier-protein] synthase II
MLLGIGPDGPVTGRRVAITGVGVVSCCGVGADALWGGLNGPPPVGERRVPDFDPERWLTAKEARQLDRFAQMSVAVADMALEDAGALDADPGRSGVIMGTGVGGLETLENQIAVFVDKGARRVSPRLVPMMMSNAGAAAVSIRLGWHGPSETIVTACAAGAHSIGHAARLVASGRCDVALGGAAEAGMTPVGMAAFSNMTALSTSGNSRPFDIRRDGFVIAEGAGALVLEAWDHAVARGAHIYGELAGSACTADAHHITAPIPGGSGAAACMTLAMEDAEMTIDRIGHINAHGTSTPLNDKAEADAITKVFGATPPPVTSTKGITGHGLGASGAIEAVAVVLSMEHALIPPTSGYEEPDPDIHLDVVAGRARPWDPAPVLSNSFGFGGHNGCLVIAPAT